MIFSTTWLVVLASVLLGSPVNAECPPNKDCGAFGECILDTRSCGDQCEERCKCDPGYIGDDCSFAVEVCADDVGPDSVRSCYNGGSCRQREAYVGDTVTIEWFCDCRDAYGEAGIHAGHQCEYPAEKSCEKGKETSVYAFCVNDGECKEMVNTGERHAGCICETGFEGRHCQYALGTAPSQELEYNMPTTSGGGMSVVAIAFTVLAALAFLAAVALFAYKRSGSRSKDMDTNVPGTESVPDDLNFELEGDVAGKHEENNIDEPAGEII